jgi:hypothetical protein
MLELNLFQSEIDKKALAASHIFREKMARPVWNSDRLD